jgi:NADPH:quinone reductase-like Zn-dependent oxidoreductase
VGSFAVQIAAALGAEVTGVCSTRNVELVRSLGAAHVIDYTTRTSRTGETQYDVILDNVSSLPLTGCAGRSPRRGPSCSTAAVRPATCSGRSAPS